MYLVQFSSIIDETIHSNFWFSLFGRTRVYFSIMYIEKNPPILIQTGKELVLYDYNIRGFCPRRLMMWEEFFFDADSTIACFCFVY